MAAASGDDQDPTKPGPGLDRRALIRRAAAVGAAAWTAPVILGSLASPAGALTVAAGTYCVSVSLSSCPVATTYAAPLGCNGSQACPVGGTEIPANTPLSDYCITITNTDPEGPCQWGNGVDNPPTVVFTIAPECNCVWTAGQGGRIGAGGSTCRTGTVSANGKSIVFVRNGAAVNNSPWQSFQLQFTCT